MESLPKYSRATNGTSSSKRRSGYEPSDVETDWQDSPQIGVKEEKSGEDISDQNQKLDFDTRRNKSVITPKFQFRDGSSPELSPVRRRQNSVSPYKPRRDHGDNPETNNVPKSVRRNISPFSKSERKDYADVNPRNVDPLSKSERRRHVSPYKYGDNAAMRRQNSNRTPTKEERTNQLPFHETTVRNIERSNISRRPISAPRQRSNMVRKTNEAIIHMKAPSVGELNEMVANSKISRTPPTTARFLDGTDSFSQGDIFFSRNVNARFEHPPIFPEKSNTDSHHPNRDFHSNSRGTTTSSYVTAFSQSTKKSSRKKSSSKLSYGKQSSVSNAASSLASEKFTSNVKKSQASAWLACMRKGSCRTSKSPKKGNIDEASFIEKASVVERLRPFWADKYQPGSLNGFTIHKQEAQVFKQIASEDNYSHILLKGPSGSGKRSLAMAFLREVYGDACSNVTHDLRHFHFQEKRPIQVVVPLTWSLNHIELNVKLEANSKHALMGIVKEIKNSYAITPEVSVANFKAEFKVIVLYEVDKAAEHIQHLIKWIMDCYSDNCRLILCCEDDQNILESVKNQCKVIKIDAPVAHEIMEVLTQIARKESFDLTTSFAAKIATKSKQNLRRAIMAMEACKEHNYPFLDDQPIPFGWEEILVELAADILADPSHKRLFLVRGKFQKLLVDFVHPKLILQKLVELFLKAVDESIKREIYYWHAYYEKRLPLGTTALLKLEEFVAKFMGLYRRSSQQPSPVPRRR
jgi:replication factor C subunit 3/5